MHSPCKPSVNKPLSATMRSRAVWVLTAACLAAWGGLGCDQIKESSVRAQDKTVADDLTKSQEVARKSAKAAAGAAQKIAPVVAAAGGKAESRRDIDDALVASLTTAANDAAGASPEYQVRAKGALARAELAQALRLAPEIDARQQQLAQIQFDLRQAGAQIATAGLTQAGYQKADPSQGDPKAPIAALDEERTKVKAAYDKADADAKAVQADLDKREAEITALEADQAKATAEAKALADKSAAAKGKESVDLFKQSSDQQQKAEELGVKIEVAKLSLAPVEAMLAVAERQKLVWDNKAPDAPGAMQGLDSQKQQLDATWSDRQTTIQAVAKSAAAIGTAAAQRSADLVALAGDTKALRDDVARKLADAAKHFGEAADACKALQAEIGPKLRDPAFAKTAQLDAWKNLLRVYDESNYRMQQGTTQLALGDLYAAYLAELGQRKATSDDLAALMKDSGVTPPADVYPDTAAKEFTDARAQADKAYEAAEKSLDAVAASSTGGDATTRATAHVLAIGARVSHLTVVDSADAKTKIDAALAEDKKWVTESATTLPSSLTGKL